jgi:hypothetical protein
MENVYLPIGTIVNIKNNKYKIMITGYFCSNRKKAYEYSGCIYPYGVGDNNNPILFNHKNIKKILYVGYYNDECKDYIKKIVKIYSKYTKMMEDVFYRIIDKSRKD